MRALAYGIVAALACLGPSAWAAESEQGEQPKEPEAAAAKKEAESRQQVTPLQAREVIERLKTMRAQLLLEQEYNRLLEARLERQKLEFELSGGKAAKVAAEKDAKEKDRPAPPALARPENRPMTPPPQLESASEQLVVKAVTVAPFKEAIVTYKGRVYTVRPGDRLGNIEIRDVNDSGVVTSGGSGKGAVMLGQ